MLFNELDLLELRLRELWPVVDRFVVVEAAFSHAGAPKPLFLAESRSRFEPYGEKLVYHTLRTSPVAAPRNEPERAVVERFQRDAIGHALAPLGLSRRDVVVVSDVDEIPRATTVPSLDARLRHARFCVFVQLHYHRYVNHAWRDGAGPPRWLGSVACRYSTLRRIGAHRVRRSGGRAGILLERPDPRWSYVEDGGWHLTWMGGAGASWIKAQHVLHVLEKASGLRDIGPAMPIQVFPSDASRERCRALQAEYLAQAEAPAFTPLDFEEFRIEQDVPHQLALDRDRFRRWFFFTSGV
jgi:Glycosyltransferase family 17